MIDDMASLKQAMEQMDAPDPAVAEAAKDRAAKILGDARLSFSKLAELIEQRRLLLRPKIVASLKRMDEPMLGDAAFRDAGSALRREGQSFRQIAEAIELNGGAAPRYDDPMQANAPLHPIELANEPREPAWLGALVLVVDILFFPIRHPLRFFSIALLAFVLFNATRGLLSFGQQVSVFVDGVAGARQRVDHAMSSVSDFVDKRISSQTRETEAPSPSPVPTPSPAASLSAPDPRPSPAAPAPAVPAPAATATAPSANGAAGEARPAPPAPPLVSAPNLDTRNVPPRPAAIDRQGTAPQRLIRNSRVAGPCIGGIGGCYWGGGRY
jgi:hypothetical protein